MSDGLALSEHLAGLGIITTPLQLLGSNPLAAYNIALILSYALSAMFAYLLVERLVLRGTRPETGVAGLDTLVGTTAALCAGLAYGFAPYRAGQLSHLQVLTSQWMPLVLLAMHAFLDDGRRRWLVLLSVAWVVQALSNGYYLLFFPVLITLWLGWFVEWRRAASRGIALAGAWAAGSLLLIPSLLKYVEVHRELGLSRSFGEMVRFSATPASIFQTPPMLAFWTPSPAETTEGFLFPGVTGIALIVAAAIAVFVRTTSPDRPITRWPDRFERSPLVFYSLATVTMWALALGPSSPDAPSPIWLRPYTVLTWLPGFDGLRAPARFAMLATLCLAVAAGLAFARVAPRRRGWLGAVTVVVGAGLLTDGWMRPMPLAAPPGRVVLPDVPDAVVLELPADESAVGAGSMYRAMTHGRPLVNAYSGHTPPHYAILSLALRRNDSSVIAELARGRSLVIIVNDRYDPSGQFLRLVQSLPGIESHRERSAGAVFVLPALPAVRVPPVGTLWPGVVSLAGYEYAQIDLGGPQVIRTVGFPVRRHYAELGERITIEASLDRTKWTTVWEDWTGGHALAAALRDPLEVPVRLTLPDVRARYLRMHPVPPYIAREIKVYGPE